MHLAFYKAPGTVFDKLIRLVTRSPYSHVELVLGNAGDGTFVCGSSSPRDGGVRIKTMSLPADRWDLAPIAGDAATALHWFEQHRGEPYDWLGVLRFVLPWVGQSPRAWFCSEACLAALGLREPWRFNPADCAALAPALTLN
jgi:hypothetical protein